jgi:magnesium transporter
MSEATETSTWEDLSEIAGSGTPQQIEAALEEMGGGAVLAISRLPSDDRSRLLAALPPDTAAQLIDQLPDPQVAEMLENLTAPEAAAILQEMQSNEQADLIGALHEEDAEAILAEMSRDDAFDARRLASYPSDVAGGLMITELLSYPTTATAGAVVDDLRARVDEYSDYDVQYAYVVTSNGVLVGVLRLRDLLLASSHKTVADLMIRDPLSVRDNATLDELADFFENHAFVGVPVTDERGRLVGVVRRHDVEEALGGRADSDYLKSQGIVGGEELRTMSVLRRSRRRLSWLSINIVLNMIAASVIALYQDTLASVIALAIFLPIISDMSGCSGNQAVAVSMRELTLGLVKPFEVMRVWSKEISVGAINGVMLGLLLGAAAWILKGNGYLGLVVGTALMVNTVVAVSIGGTIPLVLKRLRMDPALASGPILTTITDMCGFFFVLSLATMMLSRLV